MCSFSDKENNEYWKRLWALFPLQLLSSVNGVGAPGVRCGYHFLCAVLLVFFSSIAHSDVLERPSERTNIAAENLLLDITNAGMRLVAVGEYGHIIYSDDDGKNWKQADVPVSSTLTAVFFVDSLYGWAVGHEGVVLASVDGGESWKLQIDGERLNQLQLAQVQSLLAYSEKNNGELSAIAHPDLTAEDLEMLAFDARDFEAEGASRPILDVWFKNRSEGLIVGAYGLIFHTSDGGRTWTSGLDKIYNIYNFHYYAIIPVGGYQDEGRLIMVGEAGMIQRSLDGGLTWQALDSPYEGTLFGGLYNSVSARLLVFGLRGNLFQSTDLGESWVKVETKTNASLTAGVMVNDDEYLLLGSAGLQLWGTGSSPNTQLHYNSKRTHYSSVTLSRGGKLIATGERGIEPIESENMKSWSEK